MSGERILWQYLARSLRGRWHAQRHEDRLTPGIPDVSWACEGKDGWLELKALRAWPKRADTPVRVGLTAEQAAWLEARGRLGGGRCHVLVRVGQEHLLFDWREARRLQLDPLVRADLYKLAGARWGKGIDFDQLLWELTR